MTQEQYRQLNNLPPRMGKWGGYSAARQFLSHNPSPVPIATFDRDYPKSRNPSGEWHPYEGEPHLNNPQTRYQVCQQFRYL